jgi:hypothetical protein
MISFVVYDLFTGAIVDARTGNPADFAVPAGFGVIEGPYHWRTHKVDLSTGEPTESEWAPAIEDVAATVRARRDQMLTACDWTQLADSPKKDNAWPAYRQALRDITDQKGFPDEVVWPNPP